MIRVYAHRGAAAEFPENTLPAFQRAIECGADALEMDVHMTRDGVVVVSHDASGQRMCNMSQLIRNVDYAELSTWDAGWGFRDSDGQRPFEGQGISLPRFDDILHHFSDVVLNVDLKQRWPPMVERVIRSVRDAQAEDRVILASFSLATLLATRAQGYGGDTGLAAPEVLASLASPALLTRRIPLRGSVAQLPVSSGPLVFATRRKINKLKRAGMRVDFWTINEPQEALALVALGADGIMTDDPAAIVPALKSSS